MRRILLALLVLGACVTGCSCGGPKPPSEEQWDTTPSHEGEDWQSGEYPPEDDD